MPVYEIKNPTPIPEKPAPKPKPPQEVDAAPAVAKIQFFKREWKRRRWAYEKIVAKGPISKEEKSIRSLVDRVNEDLEKAAVRIHLTLIKQENDYLLEIYDCSEKDVCKKIEDVTVPFDDLPHLIKNLQEEAGILIDTIS